jgi:hypothetical protein
MTMRPVVDWRSRGLRRVSHDGQRRHGILEDPRAFLNCYFQRQQKPLSNDSRVLAGR